MNINRYNIRIFLKDKIILDFVDVVIDDICTPWETLKLLNKKEVIEINKREILYTIKQKI